MAEGNGFVTFWKKLGIVCGGVIATATVVSYVVSFAWSQATKPIHDQIAEERRARQTADSLMIRELRDIGRDVETIGSALNDPIGSARRRRKLDTVQDVLRR